MSETSNKVAGFSGVVVDGFFSEPDSVRNNALALPFKAPNSSGVGGLAWRCDVPVDVEIVERLEQVWGFKIRPLRAEIRYTLASAAELADLRGIICHSDVNVSEYTAVIYLSKDEHCKGGTSFYEHLPTNSKDLIPEKMSVNFRKLEDWRCYYSSDMAFNRMVSYRSAIFHGIKRPFFGDHIENARMIQSVRFNRA